MCNENGGSMEMMFKVIIMCNKIPEFTSNSKALRNRLMHIPFLSTWSDDAPECIKEQHKQRLFKNDPFFENRLTDLAQALGWVAVQYYPQYKKEGLTPPPIVVEYTTKHWEENDPILCFIQEKIENVYTDVAKTIPDPNRFLTSTQIYQVYKSWHSQSYPGVSPPSHPTFKASLIQRFKRPPSTNRRWYGIAIVNEVTVLPSKYPDAMASGGAAANVLQAFATI
jgi:phage/plasmid-associated DNA primase